MGTMNAHADAEVTSALSQRARGKHDLTAFSLERLDERNRWDVSLKFTRNWAAPWSRRETWKELDWPAKPARMPPRCASSGGQI
jgi:hypothetical protein